MELNQLQQLVVIAEENALLRAAQKLHISQSALTRSIQRLEDELGIQLFDRTHNSIKLNEAGKLAVRHARLVLKEAESLVTNINTIKMHHVPLHIVTCTPAPLWKLTEELSKEFQNVMITSDLLDESEIVPQLLNEKASIAITRHEIHTDEIDSMPFIDEGVLLMIPLSDPLCHKTSIHFSDLRGREISKYAHTGFWQDVYQNCLKDVYCIDYNDVIVFISIVASQKTLALVSSAHRLPMDLQESVCIPIADDEATAHCSIAWLKKNQSKLSNILNWISKSYKEW